MVRAFVLGVILLALVGVCTVRETNRQIQARYALEGLARRADEAEKLLARLRAEEQSLRSPARLAELVRDRRLSLYALAHSMPEVARAGKARRAPQERRPGEVIDEDVDVAGATGTTELAVR